MAKIFKNKKRGPGPRGPKKPHGPKKEEKLDLMDPILYQGGLDQEKYPVLATQKEDTGEEEVENPLNQR